MKNKKRNLPKTRNNLPKRIAAESDAEKASRLAFHGRHLSEIEIGVLHYLQSRESLARCIAAKHADAKHAENHCEFFGEALKELIFEAINRRDGSPLRILADAVEAFDPKPKAVDLKRAHILALKGGLDRSGEKMELTRLAYLVSRRTCGDKAPLEPEADGFAALRRLAKELRFPLAKGKTGPSEIKARKDTKGRSKS